MKKNMSGADRIIRLIIVIALVGLYFSGVITGTLGIIGLVLAAVFTVTILLGWCPIYKLVGLSTCKAE